MVESPGKCCDILRSKMVCGESNEINGEKWFCV